MAWLARGNCVRLLNQLRDPLGWCGTLEPCSEKASVLSVDIPHPRRAARVWRLTSAPRLCCTQPRTLSDCVLLTQMLPDDAPQASDVGTVVRRLSELCRGNVNNPLITC